MCVLALILFSAILLELTKILPLFKSPILFHGIRHLGAYVSSHVAFRWSVYIADLK